MPRGDKSAYTDKQKRQARHIEGKLRRAWCRSRKAALGCSQSRACTMLGFTDHRHIVLMNLSMRVSVAASVWPIARGIGRNSLDCGK